MAQRRPGNPDLARLASPAARRARIRHEAGLAREALGLYADPGFRPRTHGGVAAELNARGRRTWRGRRVTAQTVGRLLRAHRRGGTDG
jgi:hypothetical protein